MAKVGAQRAAELTGKSKSTIQRAMNGGKISFDLDANGRRVIDVSELERAYGLQQGGGASASGSVEQELQKATAMLETERMQMRIRMLEDQLHAAQEQISDLREQRDEWQKQAAQVLITSQYSQKQAEELREEIRRREHKARERRQKMLEGKVEKLNPQNENAQNQARAVESGFQGLWKKVKGR